MKQLTLLPNIAVLTIAAACVAPAMAQTAGTGVLNIGWFHIAPQDSSEGVRGVGGVVNGRNSPDAHSSVSDADTLGMSFTYFFTDNMALTADAGLPPTFKLTGQGSMAAFNELGTAKQWSPAIIAKYFFGEGEDKFRPFLGAGMTYVWYTDVKLSEAYQTYASGAAINPAFTGGTATASLSSSLAPVISAGATYSLDDKWSLGFSVSYIPLKTEADITATPSPGAQRRLGQEPLRYKTALTLNPIVTYLSVGYRF